MNESYIPRWKEWDFCEWISLCTVRKTSDWISKIWIKDLKWNIKEIVLNDIINEETYNWKEIVRVYSSGHVFISENKKEVFLVTTEKKWKIQHQFTWWSPLENENKEVIFIENWIFNFNLSKVRDNARIRTLNRTWVKVLEEYNKKPLVDWVLMEKENNWQIYYKLVCLMHFVVKNYEWILWFTQNENVIDWKWYNIEDLQNTNNVSPNAYIVSKEALKLL